MKARWIALLMRPMRDLSSAPPIGLCPRSNTPLIHPIPRPIPLFGRTDQFRTGGGELLDAGLGFIKGQCLALPHDNPRLPKEGFEDIFGGCPSILHRRYQLPGPLTPMETFAVPRWQC